MELSPFKAVFPNFDLIKSPESFFGSVKYSYNEFVDNGFFDQSRKKALYIHRIVNHNRAFLGIVGVIDMMKFESAEIKKHENTLAPKEQKQLQLILRRQAMVKPILLTHNVSNIIYSKLYEISTNQKPIFEINFNEDHELHQFWSVEDEGKITELTDLIKEHIFQGYIADGHHRSAAQNLLRLRTQDTTQYDQILCTLFASDQLDIFEYNRMVTIPFNMSDAVLIAKLSKYCTIKVLKKAQRPLQRNTLTLFLDNQWYKLKWKQSALKLFKNQEVVLDVELLNKIVLEGILGIDDIRDDERVKYIEGNVSLSKIEEKTMKTDNHISFCLYPVDIQDIMHKADIGEVMPPKSTWFEPRMKNGLIIHDFNQNK